MNEIAPSAWTHLNRNTRENREEDENLGRDGEIKPKESKSSEDIGRKFLI